MPFSDVPCIPLQEISKEMGRPATYFTRQPHHAGLSAASVLVKGIVCCDASG
jgi:hypothetical protein